MPPPRPEDGLSDLDRLTRALRDQAPSGEVRPTLPVLRSVAQALRAEEGRVTVTVSHEASGPRLVGVEAGDVTDRLLGIAVDVGTTSVAVQLVDLATGHILETRSDYNAQIPCGVDVISRINYAARPPPGSKSCAPGCWRRSIA